MNKQANPRRVAKRYAASKAAVGMHQHSSQYMKARENFDRSFEALLNKDRFIKSLVPQVAGLFKKLEKESGYKFRSGTDVKALAKDFMEDAFYEWPPSSDWHANNWFFQGYDQLKSTDFNWLATYTSLPEFGIKAYLDEEKRTGKRPKWAPADEFDAGYKDGNYLIDGFHRDDTYKDERSWLKAVARYGGKQVASKVKSDIAKARKMV